MLVEQCCYEAWPRGIIACADSVQESFFCWISHQCMVVEHGLAVVG